MTKHFDMASDRPIGLIKAGERTKLQRDLDEIATYAIAELRVRGHTVRSVELTAWKDAKQEIGYVHVISLPKVSVQQ